MFATILDNVPVGVYLKDSVKDHIRFYNRTIAERFGIDRDGWIGQDPAMTCGTRRPRTRLRRRSNAHPSLVARPLSRAFDHDARSRRCRHAIGGTYKVPVPERRWRTHALLLLHRPDGAEPPRGRSCSASANNWKRRTDKLSTSLALTDALTGLWNRRAFNTQLETQHRGGAAQQARAWRSCSLTRTTSRASTTGTAITYGDSVLRNFAVVLNRVKRAEDIACRFGGEEFAVLMPVRSTSKARANPGKRIMDSLRLFPWENEPVTVSIGLAMCSDDLHVRGPDPSRGQCPLPRQTRRQKPRRAAELRLTKILCRSGRVA